jgi:hypothetical protein
MRNEPSAEMSVQYGAANCSGCCKVSRQPRTAMRQSYAYLKVSRHDLLEKSSHVFSVVCTTSSDEQRFCLQTKSKKQKQTKKGAMAIYIESMREGNRRCSTKEWGVPAEQNVHHHSCVFREV